MSEKGANRAIIGCMQTKNAVNMQVLIRKTY